MEIVVDTVVEEDDNDLLYFSAFVDPVVIGIYVQHWWRIDSSIASGDRNHIRYQFDHRQKHGSLIKMI